MKKQYENAEMEILEFEVCDVITMSLGGEGDDDGFGDFMQFFPLNFIGFDRTIQDRVGDQPALFYFMKSK